MHVLGGSIFGVRSVLRPGHRCDRREGVPQALPWEVRVLPPHLDVRLRGQLLLAQDCQCQIVDLSRANCNLIENDFGRAGFVDLILLKPGEGGQGPSA